MLVAMSSACTETIHYSYQVEYKPTLLDSKVIELPSAEARELLVAAKTIAFFPPRACLASTVEDPIPYNLCAVILAKLQREATRIGYSVVPWENLRGTQPAVEYARGAGVDVLFQITDFAPKILRGSEVDRELRFFQNGAFVEEELAVSRETAAVCDKHAAVFGAKRGVGLRTSFDIDVISVVDGRVRWRYAESGAMLTSQTSPRVRYRAEGKMNGFTRGLFVVGFLVGSAGGLMALATADDADVMGGGVLIAGGAMVGIATILVPWLPLDKESPSAALCVPHRMAGAAESDLVGTNGSLEKEHAFSKADGLEHAKALLARAATFVDALERARTQKQ